MARLFHITDRAAWEAAARTGEYRLSTRGFTLEEQGFIHCSLAHQLRGVAEHVYGDHDGDDLIVLVIDGDLLPVPVRYEAPEDGAEPYPHVYGPLPTRAVVEVHAIRRDGGGRFILPV